MRHSPALKERWRLLSLAEQMANIGSEVERALRWRERGNKESQWLALERALELIDFSLEDPKNRGRLKEIARVREFAVDDFAGENEYGSTASGWRTYFDAFAILARRQRENGPQPCPSAPSHEMETPAHGRVRTT